MYDRRATDTYANIPASMEVVNNRRKPLRELDLRAYDNAAKRGAFDDYCKPTDARKYLTFSQKVKIVTRVLGYGRAADFVLLCKEAEHIKKCEVSGRLQ